ncbi:MAG TPA: inositol monophosphatase [Polyangia bacterium]|nr:inositol monophosphatase [Polyangia bacterium]
MTAPPAPPRPLRNPAALLARLREIHDDIRDAVLVACEASAVDQLAAAVGEEAGDTVFAIDRVSEAVLLDRFTTLATEWPCLLIAEGLGRDGRRILPAGTSLAGVEIAVIVDPIDGTRGLMYQKRPAWILTGVAAFDPAGARPPALADIALAVQTEIPLVKQHLCDTLWATAGGGAGAERWNRLTGARTPLGLRPSRAATIAQGFGGLARFFPGARAELGAVDDAVAVALLGPPRAGVALTFEDQYISTGGQLFELMAGHDRWTADLRPLCEPLLAARGQALGLCCHPYDLCTELIAREAGVVVTDPAGARLNPPLDVFSPCAWVGYANAALADSVGPALRAALAANGMIAVAKS